MPKLRVRLPDEPFEPSDAGATVRLVLRDTSQADALHPTVAETTEVLPSGGELELELEVPSGSIDPRHRYSLWVHVDRAGDGELGSGDLITTVDVPVKPDDLGGAPVDLPLTRI